MNVGELRKLLAGLDDSIPVLVRWNDDACCHVANALAATVESGCAETPALMIDADTAEESEAEEPTGEPTRDGKLWAFVVADETGTLLLEHAPELREHLDGEDIGDYLTAPSPGVWFWEGTAEWTGGIDYFNTDGAELALEGEWIKATVANAITTEAPEPEAVNANTCPDCDDGEVMVDSCEACGGDVYGPCKSCKGTGKRSTPTGSAS